MPLTVRVLTADDWQVWRDITLQSLADAPDAFRPTLAEVEHEGDFFWQEMVGPTAEHDLFNLWIAFHDGDPMGKIFARVDEELTTVHIGAMWVAPQHRGVGAGRALVDAAARWAVSLGATNAELWVTEANESAVRFYESLGFAPTDDTQFLREGSDLVVRKMTR